MNRKYDAIVLLGVELAAGDEPTEEMHARVRAAAAAFEDGKAERIVVCGGVLPGHGRAEADVMAALLERHSVPERCILREDRSQDTMENLRFAARLPGVAKGQRVLVVTSDYHRLRAVLSARRVGFRARGIGARLPRDAGWRVLRLKEWAYTFDLLMGWQDEGKGRPAWTYRLFDRVFGKQG